MTRRVVAIGRVNPPSKTVTMTVATRSVDEIIQTVRERAELNQKSFISYNLHGVQIAVTDGLSIMQDEQPVDDDLLRKIELESREDML